jgi:hypothetical protein
MAIGIYINPTAMTASQYDQIIGRLDAAGAGDPAGRLYHVCFGSGDKLQVFEVWESQQAFGKFGETLMPIIQEVGVDPGMHVAAPVHSLIPG